MSKEVLYEGPDISKHQGNVNIKAVRDAGYKRIGIRAGYGRDNVDQKYVQNAEACRNLGVPVMLYWFSYAYTVDMAEKEAQYAINQAKKYWEKCPIAFDLEYDTVRYARQKGVYIDKPLATDMAIAFLLKVKDAGYAPVLYANKDYIRNYFDLDAINSATGGVFLWYARYCAALPKKESDSADIWQYTSTGHITGVTGNVDINRFYTGFEGDIPRELEPKCNINIKAFQAAANEDGYRDQDGKALAEDGIDGPRTQYVCKKIFLKFKADGLSIKVGSTGTVVGWLQHRLNEIGYEVDVDLKYGRETTLAVSQFQRDYNLEEDGIAGYNTIQALFYN